LFGQFSGCQFKAKPAKKRKRGLKSRKKRQFDGALTGILREADKKSPAEAGPFSHVTSIT
jgi:hypothetical protein